MGMNKSDLKKAFRESVSNDFQSIPRDESQIDYEFSDSFEKKMSKLVRSEKKKSWNWFNTPYKRVALIVAILMMLFVTACSVPAIREGIINIIVNVFDNEYDVTFEGDTKDIIEQVYGLSHLPDGFQKTTEQYSEVTTYIVYQCEQNEDKIIFAQSATSNDNLGVDNEYGKMEKRSVNGYEVYWREGEWGEKDDIIHEISAFWLQDGYLMTLTWGGTPDQETMIKMIESVAPVE